MIHGWRIYQTWSKERSQCAVYIVFVNFGCKAVALHAQCCQYSISCTRITEIVWDSSRLRDCTVCIWGPKKKKKQERKKNSTYTVFNVFRDSYQTKFQKNRRVVPREVILTRPALRKWSHSESITA